MNDPSLVFYADLAKHDGDSFMSDDQYGRTCTVTEALWRPNGRYFDGTNDKIACGNISTTARTLLLWVEPDSTSESIMETTVGSGLVTVSGTLGYTAWDDAFVDGLNTDTVADTNWHCIAVTSTTDVDCSALTLGVITATYFTGLIGAIWVYSRELTPLEIHHIYEATKFRYQ